MFGLHERPLSYQCIIYWNKGSTVNKTELPEQKNPTGKPGWARQTAKASGPNHLINRKVFKMEPS